MRREPEVPEERVPVVECLDGPARITSKELAPIHSVKNGILWSACSTSPKMDAILGISAAHYQVDEQPSKKSSKNGDKIAVTMLKNTRQLGGVFQDMEPPKSSSILRKRSQTYGSQSDVFNSPKPCYVTPTFETKTIAWNTLPR